jgi:hypothetical protein
MNPDGSGDNSFYVTIPNVDDGLGIAKVTDYCMPSLDIKDGSKLIGNIYKVRAECDAKLDTWFLISSSYVDLATAKDNGGNITTIHSKNDVTGDKAINKDSKHITCVLDPATQSNKDMSNLLNTRRLYFGYYEGATSTEVKATFSNIKFTIYYLGANVNHNL